jgi:hypothetical protein
MDVFSKRGCCQLFTLLTGAPVNNYSTPKIYLRATLANSHIVTCQLHTVAAIDELQFLRRFFKIVFYGFIVSKIAALH